MVLKREEKLLGSFRKCYKIVCIKRQLCKVPLNQKLAGGVKGRKRVTHREERGDGAKKFNTTYGASVREGLLFILKDLERLSIREEYPIKKTKDGEFTCSVTGRSFCVPICHVRGSPKKKFPNALLVRQKRKKDY